MLIPLMKYVSSLRDSYQQMCQRYDTADKRDSKEKENRQPSSLLSALVNRSHFVQEGLDDVAKKGGDFGEGLFHPSQFPNAQHR